MLRWLFACLLFGGLSTAYGQLTYQQGGAPANSNDPALDVPLSHRRYVCPSGSDGNSGLSQTDAWHSVSKVAKESGNIPNGSIVTFCRGGLWTDGCNLKAIAWGEAGNPTAFGAYGQGDPPRFRCTLEFSGSSFYTVRDLDFYKISNSAGAHDFLVAYNVCRGDAVVGYPSNCYRNFGNSYHGVLVENLAYDVGLNDAFGLHVGAAGSVRDGWWLIGNYAIGNEGMEECFDSAVAEPESWDDDYITEDLKYFLNKCMARSYSGLSTLAGTAVMGHSHPHDGRFYWLVGNINGYAYSRCIKFGPEKQYAQISGNVGFACGNEHLNINTELQGAPGVNFFHNTILHSGDTRSALATAGDAVSIDYNLIYTTNKNNQDALVDTAADDSQIVSMNNNWFGSGNGRIITDGQTLAQRQSETPFDTDSGESLVAGISVPAASAWGDPRNWGGPTFLDHFIPDAGQPICDQSETPGAFDCNGNHLGLVWEPIAGADNAGCGWAGLPIVAVKLAEYGVSGSCVQSELTIARPRPPQLFAAP